MVQFSHDKNLNIEIILKGKSNQYLSENELVKTGFIPYTWKCENLNIETILKGKSNQDLSENDLVKMGFIPYTWKCENKG